MPSLGINLSLDMTGLQDHNLGFSLSRFVKYKLTVTLRKYLIQKCKWLNLTNRLFSRYRHRWPNPQRVSNLCHWALQSRQCPLVSRALRWPRDRHWPRRWRPGRHQCGWGGHQVSTSESVLRRQVPAVLRPTSPGPRDLWWRQLLHLQGFPTQGVSAIPVHGQNQDLNNKNSSSRSWS